MSTHIDTSAALRHFTHADSQMATLLRAATQTDVPVAIPLAKDPSEYFASIVSSIVSQQISIHAAAAVLKRVQTLVGPITPDTVQQHSIDDLRACGLSGQKVKYILHNAAIWHTVPIDNFVAMTDEEVIAELCKLYGIGRWTAEMFLMFSLARPDVFSYGDLGLMNGLFAQYPHLKKHHVRKIKAQVDSWSPHRTTAALVLWFYKDNGPLLL